MYLQMRKIVPVLLQTGSTTVLVGLAILEFRQRANPSSISGIGVYRSPDLGECGPDFYVDGASLTLNNVLSIGSPRMLEAVNGAQIKGSGLIHYASWDDLPKEL